MSETRPSATAADRFDAFYRAEWGRLAGTLRLMSNGSTVGDEIAQEAMTRAWQHWARVERMDRPAGWLYVTAFRLLRRRLAREQGRPAVAADDAVDLDVVDRITLERALAALPVRKRQAVVARHVLGLDGPEAAALLGMRPDGFRQLLRRALLDLRISPELLERT